MLSSGESPKCEGSLILVCVMSVLTFWILYFPTLILCFSQQELDNKGYICPQCGKSYTPLEADKLMDFSKLIFVCEICHGEVIDNENAESVRGSQDRMQRFNRAMRFVIEGLRKTESMVLPASVTSVSGPKLC